ncbi:MAG TPA: hypothetical protein VMY78_09965 [Solirubrobacteraceae bacterium]|nr:hypothetical protein [Solirubrobacteraceae bacterium]
MSDGIAYNSRSLAVGGTGSGKSELLNVQFSAMRCQRVLYDSKREFAITGVEASERAAAIDWREPTIHFQPGEDARRDAQELFAAAFARPGAIVVCVHELGDLCDYNANGAPPAARRYIVQGRAVRKGLLGGTQRPVGIPKQALTEAGDFFIFVPRLSDVDHTTIARELAISPDELAARIDTVHERYGEHAFLRWSRRGRELVVCPPLPAHVRRHNIVRRVEDA